MQERELLIALLRAAVCGIPLDSGVLEIVPEQTMEAMYALAQRQDLAHFPGHVLGAEGKLGQDELSQKLKSAAMQALYRHVRREYDYRQVCEAFQTAEIPFIPLKGTVLRDLYPQAWMRTSCDSDILVKPSDLERAVEVLRDRLGYKGFARTEHDIGCESPTGMLLELHFDTIQERYASAGSRGVLARVWEDARPVSQGAFHMVMSDAMFYYYHIAHMAKHFETGGCGVRPFLDLWILNHKTEFDGKAREELLREGGLWKFAQAAEKLAEAWFSGEAMDEMTGQMQDYIFRAGLYGDQENRAALGQAKNGGKLRYVLFQRVFMPYRYLKAEYPVLEEKKWLTPVYQVKRWLRVLTQKDTKRRIEELRVNTGTSRERTENARKLLHYLGMDNG